ncbi:branched-chain amino acid ABC transporter permease [Ancylobacter sonchi]|uniref:branched-chain amino acid ABC transporter permease n=1 Tax=Ancylobacter sonchi TaxID=1937790 RepID=UPI001BD68562|nr:branched-chain amino acid ABC transporter permease [Ancylobacter sonchi]MBS7537080.1 branched-chain amino acid ABC transporter permease [Ancylobacter sonchi]
MIPIIIDIVLRTGDIALAAVALSAGYSLVKFPNIALMQYATVGPFLAYLFASWGAPLVAAALAACIAVGLIAVLLNITVFDRLLKSGSAIAMIGSLAAGMLFTAALLVTAGPDSRHFDFPVEAPLNVFGSPVTGPQLLAVAISLAAFVLLAALLFLTDIGRCMRATATNPDLARATGIDARLVVRVIIFLSGVLAALGGIGIAVKGELNILMGQDLMLPVFAAAILGGLGNPMGAIFGALVIATAETLAATLNFGPLIGKAFLFIPANYITAASFLILVLALLFRPHGLFVNEVKRV